MKRWVSVVISAMVLSSGISNARPAGLSDAADAPANPQTGRQRRPNIVLMFPDNLGWGEVGCYGSVRGVPTPRIDQIAAEGIRLTNLTLSTRARSREQLFSPGATRSVPERCRTPESRCGRSRSLKR